MDIKQTIGEMFLVGFEGKTAGKDIEDLIVNHRVGGVILYARNIDNIGQVFRLCRELQSLRKKVSDVPLFIAIDQEGGAVERILSGVTVLPGNMAIGSVGEADCAYAAGRITATELSPLGININFSPVLDVSNNPDNPSTGVRSFGSDPEKVAALGAEMIKGLQEYGLIACAKHFPGKGDVSVDSHLDLPLHKNGKRGLSGCELVPFKAAIAAHTGFVMTAHVMYPEIAESGVLPATLSRNIVTKLLREEMGFKGVIITDDMEMGAIGKYFTVEESVIKAVEAGNDIVMLCHTLSKQKEGIAALTKAVLEKKIPFERLEESVNRISALKRKIVSRHREPDPSEDSVPFHHMVAERIARDSMTIHRNDRGVLPLYLRHGEKILAIVPRYEALSPVEEKAGEDEIILEELKLRNPETALVRIDVTPSEKDFSVLNRLDGYRAVILLTYNAHLNDKQLEFARKLLTKKEDAVIVAVRNPYDFIKLPEAATAVATYGFRNCSLKAMVEVLFGEIEAKGKMPVKL